MAINDTRNSSTHGRRIEAAAMSAKPFFVVFPTHSNALHRFPLFSGAQYLPKIKNRNA